MECDDVVEALASLATTAKQSNLHYTGPHSEQVLDDTQWVETQAYVHQA